MKGLDAYIMGIHDPNAPFNQPDPEPEESCGCTEDCNTDHRTAFPCLCPCHNKGGE